MLEGTVCLELTGADIPGLISRAAELGIVFCDVRVHDQLRVSLRVSGKDYKKLKRLAGKRGAEIIISGTSGVYWKLRRFLNRPVLITAMVFLLFLTFWLPTRVLFISIEGNSAVTTAQILQEAESCGICFGARRSVVRSEAVKNNLLEALPQLQWAGINTYGCVAVISVREDPASQEESTSYTFSSIVARRDGVIVSGTVTSGTPMFTVGQAVRAGQTLVSGYQDLGLVVKTTRSQAEIFAETSREQTVVTPLIYRKKRDDGGTKKIYSLIIGKKRINLSKGSGISYTGCDKIYSEYYVTLPGGFVLPFAITVEQVTAHESQTATILAEEAESYMAEYADSYLLTQTVSGRILERSFSWESLEDKMILSGSYSCIELIGRERSEEIEIGNGENN